MVSAPAPEKFTLPDEEIEEFNLECLLPGRWLTNHLMHFLIAKWQPHPTEGVIMAKTGLWDRLQTLWDARRLGDSEFRDARHRLLKFKVYKVIHYLRILRPV